MSLKQKSKLNKTRKTELKKINIKTLSEKTKQYKVNYFLKKENINLIKKPKKKKLIN